MPHMNYRLSVGWTMKTTRIAAYRKLFSMGKDDCSLDQDIKNPDNSDRSVSGIWQILNSSACLNTCQGSYAGDWSASLH